MYDKNDLSRIKSSLENNIGNRVTINAKKGRKKSIVRQGIIESTYPSIFVVKLAITDEQVPSYRRVSYNYIDVLTKTVEIVISEENDSVADVV